MRVILLDSNAIIHRAFHALPPLTSSDGKPTNAVYGFVSILLKIIQELKPDYIAAAFDVAAPTFRHAAFERYKATRVKAPDELYAQFPVIKEILTTLHIPIYEKEGYEADDVIGTITRHIEKKKKGAEVVIVTGDLDTLQLVTKNVNVYTMRKGISDTVLYDEKGVRDRFGFPPERLVDYKGLRGDPSDNIPGVRGIGEKTATDLVAAYGTIENVYKNLKRIKPDGVRKKLEDQKEEAMFSKELATINTRVPIDIDLEGAKWRGGISENAKLKTLFEALGFQSLVKRLLMSGESDASRGAVPDPARATRAREHSERASSEYKNIKDLVDAIKKEKACAIGLFREEGVLIGMEVAAMLWIALPSGGWYRLSVTDGIDERIRGVCEDEGIEKVAFDSKKITLFLKERGAMLRGVRFDMVLGKYLLSAHEKAYDPVSIAREYAGKAERPEDAVLHAFEIERAMGKKLDQMKLRDVLMTMEIPLVPILVEMEWRGVRVDVPYLNALSKETAAKSALLAKRIYECADEEFNISSPSQVAHIVFDKLQLLGKGLRKTKGGAQSTSASELQKLATLHPIVDLILEYRELQKLLTTYIDVLPMLVDPRDGRIHTTYNQTGTVTGRLSSSNPNLQNIPTRSETGKKIQQAFVPDPGFVFSSFDYSQMQLRIAAHMSGDEKLIDAFRRNVDIHTVTAAEINNIPIAKVTPELRREAKTLNFGVLYGMGARAFAESAGISKEKAREFIDEYFGDFAGLRAFLDALKDHAKRYGYVETLFGRRRYIPELQSPYTRMRLDGERMAINMPIQGTEADIMKLAMIEIEQSVLRTAAPGDICMIAQVHDELIFEVKRGTEEVMIPRIKAIMERIVTLKVPVIVDTHIGESWGELK